MTDTDTEPYDGHILPLDDWRIVEEQATRHADPGDPLNLANGLDNEEAAHS